MKGSGSNYLVFILLSIQSLAQPFVPVYPSKADGPVHWLDFDNDGDQDYVTMLNRSFPPVPVLFSNENGSFTEIVGALEPHSGEIKVLDYDNDGDEDIVISELYSGGSKLYKNINGTFSQQSTIIGGSRVKWIDFDSDGDIDAICSNFQNIYLSENVNGAFIPHQANIAFSDNLWDAGDFNKDGLVDLVVINKENNYQIAYIYFQASDHSFRSDFVNNFPKEYPTSFVQALDYDQDDDDDIFLEGYAGDVKHNFMYRNDGGVFVLDSDPFYNTSSPINVDEDPFPEFVTYGNLEFYNRTANGSFEKINNRMLADFFTVRSVSFSDNGRENSFVAVYGEVDPTVESTFLYQIRNGVPVPIYQNPFDRNSDSNVTFVDFDDDGWKDICVSGHVYKGTQLLKNTQTGFDEIGRLPVNFKRPGQWIDFDRDGKMDLISGIERDIWQASGFSSNISNLSLKKIVGGWIPKLNFNVIDFDKDQDMDILVEDIDGGMYVNENGLLNNKSIFPYGTFGLSAWGDYDLDGDLDVIMGNRYFKNTNSNFTEVINAFQNPFEIQYNFAADFNLDGYPDVFQTGWVYNKLVVRLYYNDKGIFKSMNTDVFDDLTEGVYGIEIIDFDNDGYPDITTNSKTKVFRNNNGIFEMLQNHGLPDFTHFEWGDIDNDGDQDLLTNDYRNYSVVTQLYRNDALDLTGPVPNSFEPRTESRIFYDNGYRLKISYHEKITMGSGFLKVYNQSTNTLIHEINVQSESVLVSGNTATFSIPTNPFNNNEVLYILIDEGVFNDQFGNKSIPISNPDKWILTISNVKEDQTISFPLIPDLLLTESPHILQASSSSGLPITFVSSNSNIAEVVSDNILSLHEAGEVSITASQAGNHTYNKALPVTRTFLIKLVTGISPNDLVSPIYPNPATVSITINLIEFQHSDSIQMTIYDSQGRNVIESILRNEKTVIDIESLNPGMYVLLLRKGAFIKSHIFVKSKL